MRRRPLGPSGPSVSALTLGARGLDGERWKNLDLGQAGAAMTLAFDRGINAVETAGLGAETLAWIGGILRREGRSDSVHILSQVTPLERLDLPCPHYHANDIYPGRHIRQATEAALKALGVERLGLLQLPAWSGEWSREGDWLETFHRLREEGKIAGFGVSTFDHDPASALDLAGNRAVDAVQVMFNLFDQGAARELLPLCGQSGVGVIARSPLYAGGLTARIEAETPFAPGDWRRAYFFDEHREETRCRYRRLAEDLAPDSVSEIALRFCLSHPAVTTVAVGLRTPDHVVASLRALEQGPLPLETLRQIAAHRWLC